MFKSCRLKCVVMKDNERLVTVDFSGLPILKQIPSVCMGEHGAVWIQLNIQKT